MKRPASPKSPLLITAVQLGLLLLVIYYAFIGGQTAQGIYDHTWRLMTLYLTTGIIGVWLVWRLFGSNKIPRTPLDFPLLLLFVSWLAATFFSANPLYSRETLVFFTGYLFFFYLAADLGRRLWFAELMFNALIGLSGLVWMLALLQLAWWYQDYAALRGVLPPGGSGSIPLPRLSVLGNPNTMAGFVTLILPLVLYKMVTVRTTVARVLLAGWLAVLIASVWLTQSRGGILAAAVAAGLFAVVWLLQRQQQLKIRWMPRALPKWGVALVAIVAVAGFVWLVAQMRGISGGVTVRQQVMAGAIKTWQHHPVTGAGLGTLGQALIQYQKPLDRIWADAHNLYLTILAETGLPGAVGLLWLLGVCVKLWWDTLNPAGSASRGLFGPACAAALTGFAVHNLVDSLLKFPVIMLLVAVLAGFWASAYSRSDTSTNRGYWSRWMITAALLVLGIVFAVGRRDIRHIEIYNQAVEAAAGGEWLQATEMLQQVNQMAPDMPFYRRQLAFAAGIVSQEKPEYRQLAIGQYRAALTQVDQLAIDHANLACLLWADEQRQAAIQEMATARRLAPNEALYALNLGYYLEAADNPEAAWPEYAHFLARQPEMASSPYWQKSALRQAALPEIIRQAAERLSMPSASFFNLIQLHLAAGDTGAARAALDAYRQQESAAPLLIHQLTGKILLAEGNIDGAWAEFEAARQLAPTRGITYAYLSEAALAQNSVADATRTIEIALRLGRGPDTLLQAGAVAAAAGNQAEAAQWRKQATDSRLNPLRLSHSRYATEVARRRPLPESYLPCLLQIE